MHPDRKNQSSRPSTRLQSIRQSREWRNPTIFAYLAKALHPLPARPCSKVPWAPASAAFCSPMPLPEGTSTRPPRLKINDLIPENNRFELPSRRHPILLKVILEPFSHSPKPPRPNATPPVIRMLLTEKQPTNLCAE